MKSSLLARAWGRSSVRSHGAELERTGNADIVFRDGNRVAWKDGNSKRDKDGWKKRRSSSRDVEVVTEDGFCFKRKRKSRKSTALPAELVPKEMQVPDYPDPSSSEPLHTSIPENWPEVRRLRSLCQSLCKVEAENASSVYKGPQRYITEAIYSVLNEFMFNVEQGLMNGEIGVGQRVDATAEKLKQKKEHLKNIKSQFEAEEKEWKGLLQQHEETLKEAQGTPEAMKKVRQAAEEAAKQIQENSCANTLAETYSKVHRALELQADGLASMVNGVEELVTRAEKIGSALVEELHNSAFQELPHINSPENLIKSLTAAH